MQIENLSTWNEWDSMMDFEILKFLCFYCCGHSWQILIREERSKFISPLAGWSGTAALIASAPLSGIFQAGYSLYLLAPYRTETWQLACDLKIQLKSLNWNQKYRNVVIWVVIFHIQFSSYLHAESFVIQFSKTTLQSRNLSFAWKKT